MQLRGARNQKAAGSVQSKHVEALDRRLLLHGLAGGPDGEAGDAPAKGPLAMDVAAVEAAATATAAAAARWKRLAPAPHRLFEAMGEAVEDRFYLFAGFYNSGIDVTQAAYVYDTSSGVWSSLSDVPMAESHVGTTTDGTTVYFVGGFRNDWFGDADDEFWMYSPADDSWTRGPSLPGARGAGALVLIGRTLHFYGGLKADGLTDSADHWALNLDDLKAGWTSRADMPNPRNHFGYAVHDGKAYAIGGQHALDEANGLDADVDVYDPATDTWSAAAPLPVARSHLHNSTLVDGERIICVGGTDPGNIATGQILEYNPAADQWIGIGRLPEPRSAAVARSIGSDLIVTTGTPTGVRPQVHTWSRPLDTLVDDDGPDLSAAVESRGPTSLIAGDKGRAVVRISNTGITRFKGPATVELRLSDNAIYRDDDILLASREKNLRLGPDKRKSLRMKFELPADTNGDYYLIGRVVPADPSADGTAANNASATEAPLTISPPFVDLTGTTSAAMGERLQPGGRFGVKVMLENLGNTRFAGNVGFGVAARPDGMADGSQDVALASMTKQRAIGSHKSEQVKLRNAVPETLAAGSYQLVVTLTVPDPEAPADADPGNDVLLSNELFSIE